MTTALHHIVAATDFSKNACIAVDTAARLAQKHQAELTLINALEFMPVVSTWGDPGGSAWIGMPIMIDAAKKQLSDEISRLQKSFDIKAYAETIIGSAHREIVHKAEEINADLIIVGTRDERKLIDRLLGSTAQNVVRSSQIPVLVVRSSTAPEWKQPIIATDFSDNALQAAKFAGSIISSAKITLMHADEPMHHTLIALAQLGNEEVSNFRQRQAEQSKRALADQAHDIHTDIGIQVDSLHRLGNPAEVISQAIDDMAADLLIIGSHGRNRLESGLLGSVGQKLLALARCDMLVVRQR